jgi:hypothetical protein
MRLAAIRFLRYLPGAETRKLLKALSTRGRFLHPGKSAKSIRQEAARVLGEI